MFCPATLSNDINHTGHRNAILPRMHNHALRDTITGHLQSLAQHCPQADTALTRAAVAIVVSKQQHNLDACIYLTLRSNKLRKHAGQFALPGGKLDQGESVANAALRELSEELGLTLSEDCVLGLLDDFQTRSGFAITPVVLWNDSDVAPTPNPDEVARNYEVPLKDLLSPQLVSNHYSTDNPVFSITPEAVGTAVYAPTAAIIYQFVEVALRGNSTRVSHYDQPTFAWR